MPGGPAHNLQKTQDWRQGGQRDASARKDGYNDQQRGRAGPFGATGTGGKDNNGAAGGGKDPYGALSGRDPHGHGRDAHSREPNGHGAHQGQHSKGGKHSSESTGTSHGNFNNTSGAAGGGA